MNCAFVEPKGTLGVGKIGLMALGIGGAAVGRAMLDSRLPGRITRLVLQKAPQKLRELGEESRILRNGYFQKSVIS